MNNEYNQNIKHATKRGFLPFLLCMFNGPDLKADRGLWIQIVNNSDRCQMRSGIKTNVPLRRQQFRQ